MIFINWSVWVKPPAGQGMCVSLVLVFKSEPGTSHGMSVDYVVGNYGNSHIQDWLQSVSLLPPEKLPHGNMTLFEIFLVLGGVARMAIPSMAKHRVCFLAGLQKTIPALPNVGKPFIEERMKWLPAATWCALEQRFQLI